MLFALKIQANAKPCANVINAYEHFFDTKLIALFIVSESEFWKINFVLLV